jgi:hypothetical protein
LMATGKALANARLGVVKGVISVRRNFFLFYRYI